MSARLQTLSFRNFGVALQGRALLTDLTFRIGAGERVALLGQSGSGKSLSARAALGLLPRQMTLSGTVEVNGTDIARTHALNRLPATRVAMIMQDTQSALNPLTSVGHQIQRPLMRHRGLSRAAAREEAARLMMRMGLPGAEILDRCSPELSGGQRQRVCIAMALASDAPFLIADEPTTALDVVTQAGILKLLRAVTEAPGGPGLLFITHDLHAAAHLCDRALVLDGGRIVEDGPMAQILNRPAEPYTRSLVQAAQGCGIGCERLYA